MVRTRLVGKILPLGAISVLLLLALVGTALADGERQIELEPQAGLPEAGSPSGFLIRVIEGDHPVEGAQVVLIAGMGGSHDSHDMGGSTPLGGAPFEVVATPGANPGEYLVEAVFGAEGTWTVWVTAEQKGVVTEAAYELPVAPAPAAAAVTPAPPVEATAPGGTAAADTGSAAVADEPSATGAPTAEGVLVPAVAQSSGGEHAEATDDGHGHGAAGDVNWLVLLGFAAVIIGATVAAALLKAHLARQIALGNLRPQGAEGE